MDEAQDKRSGAAKKRDAGRGVRFGCHVDLLPGEKPDGCVIDDGVRSDCVHGHRYREKWTCPYWSPVKDATPMTAPTPEGALDIERARGVEHMARVRSEAFRAGAEAMREAAAKAIAPFAAVRPKNREAATAWSVQHECADVVRSLDIPEEPR